MNPIQTGIAVALALAVVVTFFVFPSLSPFSAAQSAPTEMATTTVDTTAATTTADAPTTMPIQNVTQLEGKDDVVGTGASATAGDTVTVNYVGSLTDGKIFDASANHGSAGFTFVLGAGQVIKGWDQGVAGMKEGGKRTLIIPASLAYGDQGVGGVIPPGATLVFQVELVKVVKKN